MSNKKGELEFWHPGSVMKKPQWKTYTFEVLRGVYFLKHKRDPRKTEHAVLTEISQVTCSPDDNRTFVVHFTGFLWKAWTLRADTEDNKFQWMEAIKPGSTKGLQRSSLKPSEKMTDSKDFQDFDERFELPSYNDVVQGSHDQSSDQPRPPFGQQPRPPFRQQPRPPPLHPSPYPSNPSQPSAPPPQLPPTYPPAPPMYPPLN